MTPTTFDGWTLCGMDRTWPTGFPRAEPLAQYGRCCSWCGVFFTVSVKSTRSDRLERRQCRIDGCHARRAARRWAAVLASLGAA